MTIWTIIRSLDNAWGQTFLRGGGNITVLGREVNKIDKVDKVDKADKVGEVDKVVKYAQ